MKVLWTQEAEQDREDIWQFIAGEDPAAASRIDQLISDAAAKLGDFPHIGHPGRVAGTREWVLHDHYCLIYEVDTEQDIAWILAVVHTARLWPPVADA